MKENELLINNMRCPMTAMREICHGSHCMVWRWKTVTTPENKEFDIPAHTEKTDDGFCGMATPYFNVTTP